MKDEICKEEKKYFINLKPKQHCQQKVGKKVLTQKSKFDFEQFLRLLLKKSLRLI